MHTASHCAAVRAQQRARPATRAASAAFIVPARRAGREDRGIPVDLQHAHRPPARELHRTSGCRTARCSAPLGGGLALAQQLRAREPHPPGGQSSLGAADYCVRESVKYARERKPFGEDLAQQPGHPVPAGRTGHAGGDAAPADPQDRLGDGPDAASPRWKSGSRTRSRCATTGPTAWCCEAADRAMQVHGGIGYSAGTSPSSTSTATTAATASPKAPRRSRCARWPGILFGYMGANKF